MKDPMKQWLDNFPPLNLYNWSVVHNCLSDHEFDKYKISGNYYGRKFNSDTDEYPFQSDIG